MRWLVGLRPTYRPGGYGRRPDGQQDHDHRWRRRGHGRFNYTWSVEHRNAENLFVIHDPELAALYAWNSRLRAARCGSLSGRKRLLSKSLPRRHKRLAAPGTGVIRSDSRMVASIENASGSICETIRDEAGLGGIDLPHDAC